MGYAFLGPVPALSGGRVYLCTHPFSLLMTSPAVTHKPPRLKLILAFATVYLIWGSTYLGVAVMTKNLPPLFASAVRFLIAGGLLYIFARLSGAPAPSRSNWKAAFLIGMLLLTIGNGTLAIGIQKIPTGIAALLVASLPLWIVVLNWIGFNRRRPHPLEIAGVILGLTGMGILIGPARLGHNEINWLYVIIILSGTISWATGTLLAPKVSLPSSQLLSTAMQIFTAGILLVPGSVVLEDWNRIYLHHWTFEELSALAYLVLFGSIVAFSAYAWLIKVAPPALVSTYAYVNPVVALTLGAIFLEETITSREVLAAATIISGVVLINNRKASAQQLPKKQK